MNWIRFDFFWCSDHGLVLNYVHKILKFRVCVYKIEISYYDCKKKMNLNFRLWNLFHSYLLEIIKQPLM